jgi:microcin C transport system substrate-binding protein
MILVMLVSAFLFLFGCGQKSGDADANAKKSQMSEKDILTAPEEGGYGFEKLAESLGYQSYVPDEEDMIHFGDPRAVKGGTLTHITSRFPATMRTAGQNSNYEENNVFGGLIYEGLLNLHPVTLEYMPALATHWKISDDKMKFWFRINPDARFSDGEPVIAEDVIATYDLLMDETILFPSSQLVYSKYHRPVAESKYIVSVECKQLNWRNLLYFGASMQIFPAKYLREIDGTEYLKDYQFKMLPGTGPYIIHQKDIINQESFTLTRRDDYWAADLPWNRYINNFDRIRFNVVKDNLSLIFEKFKKGEADFYTVNAAREWVEETDFEAVQKGWIQKRKIFSERPAGTTGFAFNMRKWPFNDIRVRFAFAYLYDREKMNKEMYYNEYTMMNSLWSGSVYENPNNEKISYNPKKAMKLLNEAGYTKRNDNGILVHEETGQTLSFEISIVKGVDYMVTPVQQMLRDYGVDMQIKYMDGNALWKNLMERNFTIYMQSWGGLVFPNPETSLHSSLADKPNNNNISGFKDSRVDELLDKYDITFNQEERIKIIREIDSLYAIQRPAALGTARTYQRLLYWNRYGYPEYMVSRYGGDWRSILTYWWLDPEKDAKLKEAMEKNVSLPQGELEVRYWPEYLETHQF